MLCNQNAHSKGWAAVGGGTNGQAGTQNTDVQEVKGCGRSFEAFVKTGGY